MCWFWEQKSGNSALRVNCKYQGRVKRAFHTACPSSTVVLNHNIQELPLPRAPTKVVSYAYDVAFFCRQYHIDQAAQLLSEFMLDVVNFFTQRWLTISVAKPSVTVFTLDQNEFNRHPAIIVNGESLPLVRKPKLLGIRFDPLFTFADKAVGKVSRCTKVLKVQAGTS
ncbi:unnamed protein product [Dibothriocephalus latus]|uniref:Uncharacterized protein n=1 Tax=Dibothriocephalus latus TaxID=60516 RepID=A0A3P7MDZ9_DIBLA|nr:unnamed protein product [Dibothriocephalus latus]